MSITRLNHFQAAAGQADALRDRLAAVLPAIQAAPGCLACRLLQARDDAQRFIVYEEWDSAESHQAALRQTPPEGFHDLHSLLAAPPHGVYYETAA